MREDGVFFLCKCLRVYEEMYQLWCHFLIRNGMTEVSADL